MARARREASELRVRGMRLGPRFVLSMTIALAVVMGVAAGLLYVGSTNLADQLVQDRIASGVRLTHSDPIYAAASMGDDLGGGVERTAMRYGHLQDRSGVIYALTEESGKQTRFYVPDGEKLGPRMRGLIVGILVVVLLVGAGMAFWVAKGVTRPINRLVDDVRQIAGGDLQHKTKVVGGGEVELLARSIDRMTRDLEQAQEAEFELSMRERELELAGGVREALLPLTTPLVEGYDVGGAHVSATGGIGGDFHDFVEREDGRVGLLVCDVSGQGVPAALVGATARAYLRTELARADDPAEAFRKVNRWLGEDVRRGMYVTALYALVDPSAGTASILCAGHKVPLVRFTGSDGKLRVVHPEGIALGFDKGPVFDRRLEVQVVPLEPGDRFLLANSAPLRIRDEEGQELGEKGFFQRVLRHADQETFEFLKALKRELAGFAGEGDVPFDVSLVTISRLHPS